MTTDAGPSLYCPGCGYDLRGNPSDRCPECGMPADAKMAVQIAWERRAEIGRVRSLLRTARLATFRPGRIAAAMSRPVELRSARLFRRVTIGLAWLGPAVLWVGFVLLADGPEFTTAWQRRFIIPQVVGSEWIALWIVGVRTLPVVPSGWLVTLCIATSTAPWYRDDEKSDLWQDRAMALGIYGCAPLAWLVVPMPLCMVLSWAPLNRGLFDRGVVFGAAVWVSAAVLGVILVGLIWLVPVRLYAAMSHAPASKVAGRAVGIGLQWVISVVVGLILLPVIAGLWFLMIGGIVVVDGTSPPVQITPLRSGL